jgi:hypothetical protein
VPIDSYYRNAPNGAIIIRQPGGTDGSPWLVTWLPNDRADPAYPGFTMSSTLGEVPPGPTIDHVLEWAGRQPWANKGPLPEDAQRLAVPARQWEQMQKMAFEHRVRFGFTAEPDGSYSWGLFSEDGVPLQQGVADTWDDARLAMIENLLPPSGER